MFHNQAEKKERIADKKKEKLPVNKNLRKKVMFDKVWKTSETCCSQIEHLYLRNLSIMRSYLSFFSACARSNKGHVLFPLKVKLTKRTRCTFDIKKEIADFPLRSSLHV